VRCLCASDAVRGVWCEVEGNVSGYV